MDCTKNIQLKNNRVLLRPLANTDLQHLQSFVENEPEIWTYSLKQLQTQKDLQNYIRAALKEKEEGLVFPFIVYDVQQQAYTGCTRFYVIDTMHNTAMIGYTWYGNHFKVQA